ncbi:MAG: hypothetical protein DHS20C11_27650 [Lysobacteraceae bacterium]|nr:MAG: hypothetical protein DHS20C11_27650 [Xanthomonadaceae bacterium]
MNTLKWLVVGLVVAAGAAAALPYMASARISMTVGGLYIELKLLVLLGALILLAIVVWLLWRLWRLPKETAQRLVQRRSELLWERGMLALAEGNWSEAERSLTKAAERSAHPGLNYLGAAKAASAQGDEQRRDEYLQLASDSGDARHSVTLARCEALVESGQFEDALEQLMTLSSSKRRTGRALTLERQCLEGLHKWKELATDADRFRSNGFNTDAEFTVARSHWLESWLRGINDAAELKAAYRLMVGKDKVFLRPGLDAYAAAAIRVEQNELLLRQLVNSIDRHFDAHAVAVYASVDGGDLTRRLKKVESWRDQHPQCAQVELALARLCASQKLWGKARNHFTSSLQIEPTAEAFAELAELMEQLDDKGTALKCYRNALRLDRGEAVEAIEGLFQT